MNQDPVSSVYAHFIGVGGAGMSGIARVLHDRGLVVSGSDMKESRYTRSLVTAGVDVRIGQRAENLGDPEVVVISSAIHENNPEYAEAIRRGLPIWPRAKMLAHLAGDSATVAVAGTHGKTTTSAMVSMMLAGMGLDPTFVVGGEVTSYGTNARCGQGPHFVVEADESDGSFMYLDPTVTLVTNIEADHLDHYGSLEAVEKTFVKFMESTRPDGVLVLCADDARLLELAREADRRTVTYGKSPDADVRYHSLERDGLGHRFAVTLPGDLTVVSSIPVPGEHMVQNATGAIAVALAVGADVVSAASALRGYGGVKRRFDHVGNIRGVTVVDDYAHHPTEVDATIRAARDAGFDRVWVLFQPHRYSRTGALAHEFGRAFDRADRVVLMDVYSAGETPIPGISGKTLVDAVLAHHPRKRVAYLPHRSDIAPYIADRVSDGDLVITMGAGDVTAMGPEVVRAIEAVEVGVGCR